MQIKCPWDLNSEDKRLIETKEYSWLIDYARKKNIPATYFKKPDEKVEHRVRKLIETLLGPRNFILLITKSSFKTLELYYYLAVSWSTTTKKGFYVLDVNELEAFSSNNKEIMPRIEESPFLIIPYTDPTSYDLRKKQHILKGLLSKRKAGRLPTITDMYTRTLPAPKDIPTTIQPLAHIFGEDSIPMFLDRNSNAKIIQLKD
jgi:hypothetical protein